MCNDNVSADANINSSIVQAGLKITCLQAQMCLEI